jgi:hypothetical protein
LGSFAAGTFYPAGRHTNKLAIAWALGCRLTSRTSKINALHNWLLLESYPRRCRRPSQCRSFAFLYTETSCGGPQSFAWGACGEVDQSATSWQIANASKDRDWSSVTLACLSVQAVRAWVGKHVRQRWKCRGTTSRVGVHVHRRVPAHNLPLYESDLRH